MLEACDQRGLLTNGQLARLLVEGRPNQRGDVRALPAAEKATNKILHRLWEAELLERRPVILTSPRTGGPYHHFVNVLSARGAELLRAFYADRGWGELRWKAPGVEVSNQTIEHTLAINDSYVLLARGTELAGIEFFAWRDDRQLTAMTRLKQLQLRAIPDAFFVLTWGEHDFGHFLEIDRGTEAVTGERASRTWRDKLAGYAAYFETGFADEAFFEGIRAPIVLTVTPSVRRLESLLAVTAPFPHPDRYWYTTVAALSPEQSVPEAGRAQPVFVPAALWEPIWRTVGATQPRSLRDRASGETPRETSRETT